MSQLPLFIQRYTRVGGVLFLLKWYKNLQVGNALWKSKFVG